MSTLEIARNGTFAPSATASGTNFTTSAFVLKASREAYARQAVDESGIAALANFSTVQSLSWTRGAGSACLAVLEKHGNSGRVLSHPAGCLFHSADVSICPRSFA